ncbi:MAG TPA: diphthine--ammonia ligase [Flavisolibacter sp.]|nr:diphthine--ammonia ligase [Flavisolibacter sp.]
MKEKAFMSWSGGKDSALALYKAQQEGVSVEALVTTVNQVLDRVSMHGVRRQLVKQQAISLGLPLHSIDLPEMPGMQAYEETIRSVHNGLKADGFTHAVFGDVFLEDLKRYREDLLAKEGLQCLFPIWKMDSREVVRQFISQGFRALVVCVNSAHLDQRFCGRELDEEFVNDLPAGVDPCGEHGEYHSFVYDGPNFSRAVSFVVGDVVFKEYPSPKTGDECYTQPQPKSGFYFCDLLPV